MTPEGPHYHYVANEVLVPTTNTQAREYGLDLNGDKTVDNQLGQVLSTLGGYGFDIQATIDEALAVGDIILLMDFQTRDFMNTTAAGVQVFLGDSAMVTPAACNQGETYNPDTGTGCGHHLAAGSMFALHPDSPTNAALGGKIVNGTFTGGPGNLSLQIALGGTDAIQLDLIGARAKGSALSEAALGSASSGGMLFAGAIPEDDINNVIIPEIASRLGPLVAEDCMDLANPPDCGCADDSTGKTLLGLFDANMDCGVTEDEIKSNQIVSGLLSPDVTIDGVEALSLGIKTTGVMANYTVAGQ